jgi:DNA-binding transcriptional LysR family regulator
MPTSEAAAPATDLAASLSALSWDDLRVVAAVAEAGSLPAAAGRLGLDHSTVFRRLGRIEAALGLVLFERRRAGYAVTPAGEEVVALARRLDEDVTAVTRRLAGRAPTPSGEVRVTTADSLLVHLMTPLFAGFRAQCPEVRLDVVVANQSLNLSKRDADVAIRAGDDPPSTLIGRRVARIAWALYGRRDGLGASTVPVPSTVPVRSPALDADGGGGSDENGAAAPRDTDNDATMDAARPWVALGDDLSAMKVARFPSETVPPRRVVYRTNSVLALAEAVEAGIGIGHLPCFVGDVRPDLVRLAAPEPRFSADLWLLTHPDLRKAARVRALLDFLADEIARHRPLIEGKLAGSAPEGRPR